jgi:hypothetical protein
MSKNFTQTAVAMALALTALAASARATPVTFGFATTSAGGDFSIQNSGSFAFGNSYTLSAVNSVLFTSFTVGGDPTVADNKTYALTGDGSANCSNTGGGNLTMSGNTLSLYGAVTGLTGVLSTGCNLLASITGNFTGTYLGANSGQFLFAGWTSVSESPNLLSALHLTGGYSGTLNSGGINGNAGVLTTAGGISTEKYIATSEQFQINLTATPEPYSFVLMGAGIVALIFRARKKHSVAV